MHRAKVLLVSVILLAMVALVASCGQAGGIGIAKFVSHPALDAVEKGIIDELMESGVTLKFDLQDANADSNAAATIASKFKNDNVAIAIGIATPTAQSLVQTLKTTPIVFSAVTDPVAAGLVTNLIKGGENVTGISDLTPVKEQIQLLIDLVPSVKRLGMVYTGSEANAVILMELAKKAAADLGLEFVPVAISTSAEVKSAGESILGRVDAFYVSTDNTVVSALPALAEVARLAKKPVISADPSSSKDIEVLASWGFNYYKMGRATGRLVLQILQGAKPGDIPTSYMTNVNDVELLINLDSADNLGITVPPALLDAATFVIKNGKAIEKK